MLLKSILITALSSMILLHITCTMIDDETPTSNSIFGTWKCTNYWSNGHVGYRKLIFIDEPPDSLRIDDNVEGDGTFVYEWKDTIDLSAANITYYGWFQHSEDNRTIKLRATRMRDGPTSITYDSAQIRLNVLSYRFENTGDLWIDESGPDYFLTLYSTPRTFTKQK